MFQIGMTVKWYPGNTDYPSLVILLDKDDEGNWLVAYANDGTSEKWQVPESDLFEIK